MKTNSPITRHLIVAVPLLLIQAASVYGMAYNRPTIDSYTGVVEDGTWSGKAIEERWSALGATNTVILPVHQSQQGYLTTIKSHLQALYPHYVDLTKETGGSFDSYFSTQIGSQSYGCCPAGYLAIYPSSFPMLSITSIVEATDLPHVVKVTPHPYAPIMETNVLSCFFSYTPSRNLDGQGIEMPRSYTVTWPVSFWATSETPVTGILPHYGLMVTGQGNNACAEQDDTFKSVYSYQGVVNAGVVTQTVLHVTFLWKPMPEFTGSWVYSNTVTYYLDSPFQTLQVSRTVTNIMIHPGYAAVDYSWPKIKPVIQELTAVPLVYGWSNQTLQTVHYYDRSYSDSYTKSNGVTIASSSSGTSFSPMTYTESNAYTWVNSSPRWKVNGGSVVYDESYSLSRDYSAGPPLLFEDEWVSKTCTAHVVHNGNPTVVTHAWSFVQTTVTNAPDTSQDWEYKNHVKAQTGTITVETPVVAKMSHQHGIFVPGSVDVYNKWSMAPVNATTQTFSKVYDYIKTYGSLLNFDIEPYRELYESTSNCSGCPEYDEEGNPVNDPPPWVIWDRGVILHEPVPVYSGAGEITPTNQIRTHVLDGMSYAGFSTNQYKKYTTLSLAPTLAYPLPGGLVDDTLHPRADYAASGSESWSWGGMTSSTEKIDETATLGCPGGLWWQQYCVVCPRQENYHYYASSYFVKDRVLAALYQRRDAKTQDVTAHVLGVIKYDFDFD